LEYSELLHTPEIAGQPEKHISMPQNVSENMPHLKQRYRTHHWKEMNRKQIMQLLAFFTLQGLHQNQKPSVSFPRGKYWKHPYFWTCSV
jgi:hypothetical protein